jgi:anti-sigma factor RsiW
MTNDPTFQRLLEISWRRKLTDAEAAELQTWLVDHPTAEHEWQSESGLNDLLEVLPETPVPSNFTSRVLAEVRREAPSGAVRQRKPWSIWDWRFSWLPRAGFAALVLAAGAVAYRQHEASSTQQAKLQQQAELARQQSMLRELARVSMPSPQILTNYDAIRLMTLANTAPSADVQLLTLMQ